MKCYVCNSKLMDDRDTCPKCGADIRLYRKIIYTSNQYYNLGLMRARARDLTGAAETLKTSLQLNKKNIDARNLLGLVYYEMGEGALALKEWVISKNLRSKNNMADNYIRDMRENRASLDSVDHSIHKFNQALEYAKTGARDLATIQLKKVITVNPHMLKAYELLALLYMREKRYDQAKTVIAKCLEIDKGNPNALAYMRELEKLKPGSVKAGTPANIAGEVDREEIIIPVRMRDAGTYFTSALFILFGFLLGLGVLYYVIMPAKEKSYEAKGEGVQQEYEDKYVSLNAQITDLQNQLSKAQDEKDGISKQYETDNEEAAGLKNAYEELLKVAELYIKGDYVAVADEFPKLEKRDISDELYNEVYQMLKDEYDDNLTTRIFQMAKDARENQNDRELAIQYCDKVIEMDRSFEECVYYRGLCYQELNQFDKAVQIYVDFYKEFPRSPWFSEVRNNLLRIAPTVLEQLDKGIYSGTITVPTTVPETTEAVETSSEEGDTEESPADPNAATEAPADPNAATEAPADPNAVTVPPTEAP